MSEYSKDTEQKQLSYTEPQDEYVCSECGDKVGLVIDGICLNCSNNLQNSKQKL